MEIRQGVGTLAQLIFLVILSTGEADARDLTSTESRDDVDWATRNAPRLTVPFDRIAKFRASYGPSEGCALLRMTGGLAYSIRPTGRFERVFPPCSRALTSL